jgi:hypothetical protein
MKGIYHLDGDQLTIRESIQDYPKAMTGGSGTTTKLVRETKPIERAKPSGTPPIDDAVLGRLTWDDNLKYWAGKVKIGRGKPVNLSITPAKADKDLAKGRNTARRLVEWLQHNEPNARAFAAKRLLELFNDVWRTGRALDAAAFAKRPKLETIAIEPSGSVTLWYADGGLFRGHSITVDLSSRRTFKDAQIQG